MLTHELDVVFQFCLQTRIECDRLPWHAGITPTKTMLAPASSPSPQSDHTAQAALHFSTARANGTEAGESSAAPSEPYRKKWGASYVSSRRRGNVY